MINKIAASIADALAPVKDGDTVMIGGFGTAGIPIELIDGLIARGAKDLTIVNNNAGNGDTGLAALLKAGSVRKIICSFPRQADSQVFDGLYRSGQIELELVPQGNLAERIRAAGAGIGAFFTPSGYGTDLAKNPDGSPKETREIKGKHYVLEYPIYGDVALIKAERGDRFLGGTQHLGVRLAGRRLRGVAHRVQREDCATREHPHDRDDDQQLEQREARLSVVLRARRRRRSRQDFHASVVDAPDRRVDLSSPAGVLSPCGPTATPTRRARPGSGRRACPACSPDGS